MSASPLIDAVTARFKSLVKNWRPTYGRTDDYGYNVADEHGEALNPDKATFTPGVVHVHDLQATILHLLGLDHERLSFYHNGIERRLTDVHGHVIRDVLA